MGKSIIISIKPEWVAKILNGEKTIEIRKNAPKCDLPIDVYIYATKRQNLVLGDNFYGDWVTEYTITRGWSKENVEKIWGNLSGKVVAKFTLKSVDSLYFDTQKNKSEMTPIEECIIGNIERHSCLSQDEIEAYAKPFSNSIKICYAWHISDLEIFDEPKPLSEFGLTKAPQSWQYVEVEG